MKQGRDRMLHPGVRRGGEQEEEPEENPELDEQREGDGAKAESEEAPAESPRRLKCIYCGSTRNKVLKNYGKYTARIDQRERRRRKYRCESCRRDFITDELVIGGVSSPDEE